MAKLVDCGNVLIVYESNLGDRVGKQRIKKIDKEHYEDLITGEICEYSHYETKGNTIASVRRAFGRLKAIINCNYERPEQVALLTLTYADNMRDYKRVSRHMSWFLRKVRREFDNFRYVYVKETQGRGAWHMHVVLFFDDDAPKLDKRYFNELWGHGYTDYRLFRGDINNLGQYLTSCLTSHGKADVKQMRLLNYDAGMHLYCCGANIKRPVVYDVDSGLLEEVLAARNAVFRSSVSDTMMLSCDMQVDFSKAMFTCDYTYGVGGVEPGERINRPADSGDYVNLATRLEKCRRTSY